MEEYIEMADRYYEHLQTIPTGRRIEMLQWNGLTLSVIRNEKELIGIIHQGLKVLERKVIKKLEDLAYLFKKQCEEY